MDLREITQICDAIVQNVSDKLIIFDNEGKIIKLNDNAKGNITYDYRELGNLNDIYKDAEGYYNGKQITFENLPFCRVLKGEKFNNERYVFKQKNVYVNIEVSGIPIYDEKGNIAAGIMIFRNISKKLEYEEFANVESQYATLKKIVENLDLCFARFTYPEFEVIEYNNKAYDLLNQINSSTGLQMTLYEFNFYNLLPVKKDIIELIHLSFEKKDNYQEVFKYNISGNEVYYKFIYQPLLGKNNNILEVVAIGFDVTKDIKSRKKMERTLKIQDEIYANVSHELKTPLSVIFSANQMMDIYMKEFSYEQYKEKILDYNNIIKQNCYRLTKIINNIVDMSKNNTGNFKLNASNENIVDVVENIVNSVAVFVKSKNLKIIFDTDVEEKIIACDTYQIERVMLNLISNAIKFSNANGEIRVNIVDKGTKVEIIVKDEGVGIEAKHLTHIFQRYYQVDKSLNRNAEGSGIGLSLVKLIVEKHGGKIYAKSKVNEGSTFIIELPAITLEQDDDMNYINNENNKVEMIKTEFSDIYNI